MVLKCIFITKKGTKYRHHVDSCFPHNNSTKTVSHHFLFLCSFDRHPVERKQEVGDQWHEKHSDKSMMRKIKYFPLQCCLTSVIYILIRTVKSVAYQCNII